VDTSRVEAMFAELLDKSEQLDRVMAKAANDCRASVSGIPVDAGRLAGSLKTRPTKDGAEVYTDVEYSKFVFGGTKYQPARPPTVGYTAAELADDVSKELFS
jgi:hypothetical protein